MQIWRSDGSPSGTFPVTNFPYITSLNSVAVNFITKVGTYLYFTSDSESETGNELWKTNGTIGGLSQLTDLPRINYDGYYFGLTAIKGSLYFGGGSKAYGLEPWKSDGTTNGTKLLKDIKPANPFLGSQYSSSNPNFFTEGTNQVFFVANTNLWKTDGSPTGTQPVSTTITSVNNLVFINNVLYFSGYQNSKSTVFKLEDPYISPQILSGLTAFSNIIAYNSNLYFSASDAVGSALWKYNVIEKTTEKIKQVQGIGSLVPVRNLMFFSASDGSNGNELWKSDGTSQGTVMVKDITEGSASSMLISLKDVNGVAYFFADDSVHGLEPWKSDGTLEGTVLIKDIWPGSQSSISISQYANYSSESIAINSFIYFSANDGVHGKELWSTDGTDEGTKMVIDINTGEYSSSPYNLIAYDGVLYFTAYDNTIRTLWKTNGISCGTIKATNNTNVIAGGEGKKMALLNETIFIEGWTADVGMELRMHAFANDIPVAEGCKQTQNIMLSTIPKKQFGDYSFQMMASASSGLPVEFSTDTPDLISLDGNKVSILKAGTAIINVTQSGNRNFAAASVVTREIVINKANQTIEFESIGPKKFGDAPFKLSSTASSGLSISFESSDPSIASVSENNATIHKPGITTIKVIQAGNENYTSASTEKLLQVNKGEQKITFQLLDDQKINTTVNLIAVSNSGLPVSFSSSPHLSISSTTATLNNPGKAAIEAKQGGNEFYNPAPSVSHFFCINPLTPHLSASGAGDDTIISFDNTQTIEAIWYLDDEIMANENTNSLSPTITGSYSCRALVEGCVSERSNEISFVITGIENLTQIEGLNFYPNPATNNLNIEAKERTQKVIQIFNAQGEAVFSAKSESQLVTLDTSHLQSGIYLIRVYFNDQVQSGKLVIR